MSLQAAVGVALLILLSACTVDSSYGGAGFACSDTEPCQAGFDCNMGICKGGAAAPDGRPGDGGSPDPDAAEIVCLPPIAVSDEFPGDTLDAQWTTALGSGTSAVVADGVLTLTPRSNSVPRRVASVRSQAFAVDGKRAFAEIPAMVDPGTTAFGELQLAAQNDTHYFIRQSQGVLQFGTTIAGTELILAATDYNAVGHRWWQMRMTGGRLYADVSADGSIWVNLDSAPADVIVGDLYLELSAGTRESIATPGAMQVDNVNAGSGLCL